MPPRLMIFLAAAHALLAFVFVRTRGDRGRRRALEAIGVYMVFAMFLSWIDGPGVKPLAFAALVSAIHLGASWASSTWYFRAAPVISLAPSGATPIPGATWCPELARQIAHLVAVDHGVAPAVHAEIDAGLVDTKETFIGWAKGIGVDEDALPKMMVFATTWETAPTPPEAADSYPPVVHVDGIEAQA